MSPVAAKAFVLTLHLCTSWAPDFLSGGRGECVSSTWRQGHHYTLSGCRAKAQQVFDNGWYEYRYDSLFVNRTTRVNQLLSSSCKAAPQ